MPKRILVVDDDPIVQALAKERLKYGGYEVETASNGEVALHILNRLPVHIIITDVNMPKMDGVDFYRELKKNVSYMTIPVVIVCEASDHYRELFQKLGVKWFIEKPFNPERLLMLVYDILKDLQTHEKILISGGNMEIVNRMSQILEEAGQKTAVAPNGPEAMAMALTIIPKIILVDLLMVDIAAHEMVKALHCFVMVRDTKIITYTQFDPGNVTDVNSIEQLQQERDECAQVGATHYIGRFSAPTFLQTIREFL